MCVRNKNFKRILGFILALTMAVCMMTAFAVQTSAAVGDGSGIAAIEDAGVEAAKPISAAYYVSDTGSGMTIVVLIFVIVFLVLALVAVVVVILVVVNKKKENGNPAPNSIPSPAPTNAQSFNHVQPQNVQQTNHPQGYKPPQAPAGMPNAAPAIKTAAPADGAGDTTVLGVGSAGFILMRTNGGEKISINKPEFYLGKEKAKVDYCISNNNSISRRHAKIKVRAGKCYISDLGSTNCTFINGTKLSPNQEIALIPGDKIKLSNEEFEFIG